MIYEEVVQAKEYLNYSMYYEDRGSLREIKARDFIVKCINDPNKSEHLSKIKDNLNNKSTVSTKLEFWFFKLYGTPFLDFFQTKENNTRKLFYPYFFNLCYKYVQENNEEQLKEEKPIKSFTYTRFKTTGLFYSEGVHLLEMFEGYFKFFTQEGDLFIYEIISFHEISNKSAIFIVQNYVSGLKGEVKFFENGKVRLRFENERSISLKQ